MAAEVPAFFRWLDSNVTVLRKYPAVSCSAGGSELPAPRNLRVGNDQIPTHATCCNASMRRGTFQRPPPLPMRPSGISSPATSSPQSSSRTSPMTSDTRPSAPHASHPPGLAADNAIAEIMARSTARAAAGLLAATLFTTAQVSAQSIDTSAPLPPVGAWHGASEALIVAPDDPWSTPAERNDFASTPSYDETRAWLERLVAASPLLSLDVFGKSSEGRDLLLVRAHKGAPGKPVVLAQAGIHAGEIDGKDAGLMLLRDIAQRGKDHLLDQVDLVFVPIFNADGHEQRGPLIGAALRGPQQMGWNTTTRGINLNRDYLTWKRRKRARWSRCCIAWIRRFTSICMSAVGWITSTTSPLPSPAGAPMRARAPLPTGCSNASRRR